MFLFFWGLKQESFLVDFFSQSFNPKTQIRKKWTKNNSCFHFWKLKTKLFFVDFFKLCSVRSFKKKSIKKFTEHHFIDCFSELVFIDYFKTWFKYQKPQKKLLVYIYWALEADLQDQFSADFLSLLFPSRKQPMERKSTKNNFKKALPSKIIFCWFIFRMLFWSRNHHTKKAKT